VEYVAPARTEEYVRKHGWCVDNIEIFGAEDEEMGRGAFARRSLAKGSIVAPAPIQVFKDRSAFQRQQPESVFVNYCFEVPGTSILLYPYGPGVNLINHASGDKANVELRWSKSPTSHYTWLDLPLDQFWDYIYPGGLVMEVVAIRNIEQGEELFMDYGTRSN